MTNVLDNDSGNYALDKAQGEEEGEAMKRLTAIISFVVVFAFAFILGGWFLMPHLPPTPSRPVGVMEAEYWTTNWAGALLGLILGLLSARSALKKAKRETR